MSKRRPESGPPRRKNGDRTAAGHAYTLGQLLTLVVAVVAAVLVWLRIWLVRDGIMYGDTPVTQANWVASAFVLLSAIMIYRTMSVIRADRRRRSRATSGTSPAEAPAWGDNVVRLVTVATAIAAGVAGVSAVVNVWAPKDPPGLPVAACPGVRVWNTPYAGTNVPTEGVNGRSGPARSYPPDRRLAGDCSVGFAAYCLGDPITDPSGTTDHERWVDTRWLLIAKQPGGLAAKLAHWLSGETSQPQFVSEALVAPQRPYDDVKLAHPGQCPGNYPSPQPAVLAPVQMTGGYATLTATSTHAANMGFAVWKPAGQPFLDPNSYLQVYNSGRAPTDNPGTTDAAGSKTVIWPFRSTLVTDLKPVSIPGHVVSADVVVFAIPCLSDNVPADRRDGALAVYTVSSDGSVKLTKNPAVLHQPGLDRDQLARTACEAIV